MGDVRYKTWCLQQQYHDYFLRSSLPFNHSRVFLLTLGNFYSSSVVQCWKTQFAASIESIGDSRYLEENRLKTRTAV
ncbi:hypothetical protein CYMTET_52525 [Cymbomonas tetramitiformis]|uniref:Uncharacterized protein n=1 Tax=Cymbomonas tetramitiformis TaxID=36881 RepID=A0AAE0ER03_9CHLO|nr:hypothetical protein CYMTET_52525 [Cymbomonas tetramitiformis]